MKKLYLITGSLIITLVINYLSVNLPLNGITTQAVSDLYLNYFTPAGYVFSIWGLIYLSVIGVNILFWKEQKKFANYIEKSYFYYVGVNILNAIWLVLWHYQVLWLSVIVMGGIFYMLLKLYFFGREDTNRSKLVIFSNSLYLGWISVATIANISALLSSLSFSLSFISNVHIAILMYLIALILGVLMVKNRNDWVFYGVIVWAIIGIINRFADINTIFVYGITLLILSLVSVGYIKLRGK